MLQGKRQKKGGNIQEDDSKVDEVLEKEETIEASKPRRGGRRRKNEERVTESEGAACKETGRSTRSRKNQMKQAAELKQSVSNIENIAEDDQNETGVDEAGVVVNAEPKEDPSKETSHSEGKGAKVQANDRPDEAEPMDEGTIHIVSTAPVENANYDEEARHDMVGHDVQDKGQSPGTVDPYGEVPSIEVKKGERKDHGSDQGIVENAQGFDNGPVHDMEEQSPISHKSDPVSGFDKHQEDKSDGDVQNGERPMSEREYQTQEASPSLKHLEEEVVNEMPPKTSPGKKSHSNDSKTGFAANLISSVKTLLPSSEHTSSQEAEKSEYVDKEAILREERKEKERLEKEEAKKQAELEEKARLERIQAEKAREQEQLRRQKEEEIAAKRRARQEEERRKREEKAKRLEEHKRRRKLEAEAAARSGSGVAGLQGAAATSGGSLAAAKERLAKIQQQAAMLKNNSSKTPNDYPNMSTQNRSTFSGTPQRVVKAQKSMGEHPTTTTPKNTQAASPSRAGDNIESHYRSYEISPYRSDHASDDDVPKKPVPEWARGKTLMAQLVAQMYVDPDEVFQQHAKTCSLDQVFANSRKNGRRDFNKRNSSGNWIEDRVTWKEELGYKKAMGYI